MMRTISVMLSPGDLKAQWKDKSTSGATTPGQPMITRRLRASILATVDSGQPISPNFLHEQKLGTTKDDGKKSKRQERELRNIQLNPKVFLDTTT